MIQLNLLPDVKLEFIKAQRTRRMIFAVSAVVTIAAVSILVLLFVIGALQKKHISDLSDDITTKSAELKNKPKISRILTVQNQLERLTELHSKKPAVANLFGYLDQMTPTQVNITNFNINFEESKMTIDGGSDTLSSVNRFIDTLKFTTYSKTGSQDKTKAFKDVVLVSFKLDNKQTGQTPTSPATYSVELAFDPAIFDITQKSQLNVPNQTSTRSALPDSPDLFQGTSSTTNQGSN